MFSPCKCRQRSCELRAKTFRCCHLIAPALPSGACMLAVVKSKVVAATGRSRIGRQLQRLVLQCAAFAVTGCLLASPNPSAGGPHVQRAGHASVLDPPSAPALT